MQSQDQKKKKLNKSVKHRKGGGYVAQSKKYTIFKALSIVFYIIFKVFILIIAYIFYNVPRLHIHLTFLFILVRACDGIEPSYTFQANVLFILQLIKSLNNNLFLSCHNFAFPLNNLFCHNF